MDTPITREMFDDAWKKCELNDSQKAAIEGTFNNALTVITGPPGTGKTRTAIEMITLWKTYLLNNNDDGPILATAYTNTGVDQLMRSLIQKKLKVVRIGTPSKIHSDVRNV